MTLDEAMAAVQRLCPAEVTATLRAHLRRPAGGHALGRVAVEQQSTRADPRAETEPLDEEPTKRERRPASGHFLAATRILKEEP